MMHKSPGLLIAVVLVCAGQVGPAAAGPFDALLRKVPPGANALVLIDVSTTLATPVAEQEGWGKQLELSYVDRPIFLPPEATKLVLAASLYPNADFSTGWELAAMELAEPMSMRQIARSEGGYLDTVRGTPAVWTPSDAYFVSLGERTLGAVFPAERQFVSRWMEYIEQADDIQTSNYLSVAARLANTRVPILLAIDLEDVVRPHVLAQKLRESTLFQDAGISLNDAATVLTSLRGVMLRVAVGDDVQGQLRIDFHEPVAPLEKIAKALVLNTLNDFGAHIEDLAEWKLELEEKAITLRGPLSEDGQRRVFSVVEIPSTKFSTLKDAEPEMPAEDQPPSESKIREASLTYYRATDVLIKDLNRDLRGNKAAAAVMERYARRIDRMPILNVDDELLDYGSELAGTLRSIALSKRSGGIQAGTQTTGMGRGRGGTTRGVYYNYNTGFGFYGTGRVSTPNERLYAAKESAAERSAIKAQAMAGYKNARVEGFKQIAERSAAIRRQMTQKYGVEF